MSTIVVITARFRMRERAVRSAARARRCGSAGRRRAGDRVPSRMVRTSRFAPTRKWIIRSASSDSASSAVSTSSSTAPGWTRGAARRLERLPPAAGTESVGCFCTSGQTATSRPRMRPFTTSRMSQAPSLPSSSRDPDGPTPSSVASRRAVRMSVSASHRILDGGGRACGRLQLHGDVHGVPRSASTQVSAPHVSDVALPTRLGANDCIDRRWRREIYRSGCCRDRGFARWPPMRRPATFQGRLTTWRRAWACPDRSEGFRGE